MRPSPHDCSLGGEKRPRPPCLGGRGSGKLKVKKQNPNFKVKIMAQMVKNLPAMREARD